VQTDYSHGLSREVLRKGANWDVPLAPRRIASYSSKTAIPATLTDPISPPNSSLKVPFVNAEKMAAHLRVDRYEDFVLTAAVRPGLELPVVPRQGFRLDVHRDGT